MAAGKVDGPGPVAAGSECLTQTFTRYVGVTERTGRNDGPQVEQFLKAVNLGPGYAWCAAFVRYCLDQCQVKTPITAWAPSAVPAHNRIYHRGKTISPPAAGDVFGIWYTKLKRIGHVGFILSWPADGVYATTIEGNTNGAGSREGDGVYKKFRAKSLITSVSRWVR